MKLLFDHNLSPRLVGRLGNLQNRCRFPRRWLRETVFLSAGSFPMLPAHLAENFRQQVLYYLPSTDVADRIEVTHLHALARTICFRSGWRGRRCISASMPWG
jgi:hypothetical protein